MGSKRTLPTVYLDTSVLSALHYGGGSFQCIYRAMVTREWWQNERLHFRAYCSVIAEGELRQGKYDAQEKAVAEALRLPYLPLTSEVRELAHAYFEVGLVPRNQEGDALQLALATANGVDYLMTWNHAHLANAMVQARLLETNQRQGRRSPWLVSPESIPKQAFGQVIRRRK